MIWTPMSFSDKKRERRGGRGREKEDGGGVGGVTGKTMPGERMGRWT
jgi:hypothetical protein